MDAQQEINEGLEDVRSSRDPRIRTGRLNRIRDLLGYGPLAFDFMGGLTDNLIDMIILETDDLIRGQLFDVLERALMQNPACGAAIDRLIAYFSEDDPALIANTLLLFSLAGSPQHIILAQTYTQHPHAHVRANAEYAIKYARH